MSWRRREPGYQQAWSILNSFTYLLSSVIYIYITEVCHRWFWSWWRHQIETFSALLAICARNSPVTGKFPAQRPVTRSFDVFFDLRLNKRLSKQWWGWWFETQSHPLWRHCDGWRIVVYSVQSHYIDLCYVVVNWALWDIFQWHFNKDTGFPLTKMNVKMFLRPFNLAFGLWICLLRSTCCHMRYATQALRPLFTK